MRKVVLEGHRFGAKEALENGMVDVVSPAQGESGGAGKTLQTATELAHKLAPKAGADAYYSNKIVMYQSSLAILREK
jgi:enoyl-CoA hydratase/carnithine racemase